MGRGGAREGHGDGTRDRDDRTNLAVLLSSGVLFLVHGLLLYGSTGRDDVHITYWAAHSLVESGQILNYNGVAYEQSSSLLHTLVLALVSWLTPLPLSWIGPLVSVGAGLLTLWLVGRLAVRLGARRPGIAVLLTALLAYLVYWAFSGMETTTVAALVVAVALSAHGWMEQGEDHRALVAAGLLLAFLAVRPESGFVLIAGLVGYAVWRRVFPDPGGPAPAHLGRREAWAVAGGVLLFAGLTAWRLHYFGMAMPGPVEAKVTGVDMARLSSGLGYLEEDAWVPSLMGLALGATLGLLGTSRQGGSARRLGWLTAAFVLAYLGFSLASGGDWMEGGRLFVPALPLAAALAARGMEELERGRLLATVTLALLMTMGAVLFATQVYTGFSPLLTDDRGEAAMSVVGDEGEHYSWWERTNRVHLRDIPTIAAMSSIMDRLPEEPRELTVWSKQGGMVFDRLARRYGDRLEFVDLAGLTTRHLHGCELGGVEAGTHWGVINTYDDLLSHRDRLQSLCGVPRPDFIIDIVEDGDRMSAIRRSDYRVVYWQSGVIEPTRGFLGAPVLAHEFIAVDPALADLVGSSRQFQWP